MNNNSPINSNFNILNYNNTNNLKRSAPPPKKDNKKFNFKTFKNNTICSLNEVEHFLNNFQQAVHCIKIFKLLK